MKVWSISESSCFTYSIHSSSGPLNEISFSADSNFQDHARSPRTYYIQSRLTVNFHQFFLFFLIFFTICYIHSTHSTQLNSPLDNTLIGHRNNFKFYTFNIPMWRVDDFFLFSLVGKWKNIIIAFSPDFFCGLNTCSKWLSICWRKKNKKELKENIFLIKSGIICFIIANWTNSIEFIFFLVFGHLVCVYVK